MGFLDRLLNRPTSMGGTTAVPATVAPRYLRGSETLEVVGEASYQDALWAVVGGLRSERVRHNVGAVLVPEPSNQHDENAVMVLVSDHLVGYLSRHDAALYGPGLRRLITASNAHVGLYGVVVGGGHRGDGLGFLGVFLDHDPADFGVTPQRAADIAGFRTGLSEAMASDLEDDSYDLSWYRELATDSVTAIKQLRTWLETDPDPIDRHYMMNELEARLYKSRDSFASALDGFDAVCRQHDVEMDRIRQALFDKFGKVPVLDTYRQSAIRCQKSREWSSMLTWAERGLEIYGNDAVRQEAVDDLRKRQAYAAAKLGSVGG